MIERVDTEDHVGPIHEFRDECLGGDGEPGFGRVEVAEIERSIALCERLHRDDASPLKKARAQLASGTDINEHLARKLCGVKPEVLPEPRGVDGELWRSASLIRSVVGELMV